MKKIFALLISLITIFTCFFFIEPAECSPDAQEKRVVSVYTKKREWDWATIEARYEAYNPEVDLVVDATDAGTYYDLLKGYLASGDLPDVIQITSGATLDDWQEYLVPLDGLEAFSHMNPTVINEFAKDGKVYGAPLFAELHGVIYNMGYLNEVGWTTTPTTKDEFVKLNEDLIAAGLPTGISPWSSAAAILGHMTAPVFSNHEDAYAYQNEIINGKADLDNDEFWNGFWDYLDLTMKYGNPDALVTDNTTERNALYTEEYAWYAHDGSWLMPQIKALNPDLENRIALGVYPYTNDPEKNKIGNSIQGISVMNTEHQEDAKNFINWLVGTDDGSDVLANVCNVVLLRNDYPISDESVGALGVQGLNYVSNDMAYNNFRGFPTSIQQSLMAAIQKYLANVSKRSETNAEIIEIYSTCK